MAENLAIFRDTGLGTRLCNAANDYLKDYFYDPNPDEFSGDHQPTDFERGMMEDFIAGLFAEESFAGILQEAARGMKAGGMDPEGEDKVA